MDRETLVEDVTHSEQFRHRCEVRQVLRYKVRKEVLVRDYLILVKQMRGDEAHNRLKQDVDAQFRRGNVGAPGDWRAA